MKQHALRAIFALLCLLFAVNADTSVSSQTNAFEANLLKRVDPYDEEFRRALWDSGGHSPREFKKTYPKEIRYSLDKKHEKRKDFVALIRLPTCLKCANKARSKGSSGIIHSDYTAAKFVNKISVGGMDGGCFFYGQRPKNVWPRGLSGTADTIACQMRNSLGKWPNVRAIWHMWPQDDTRDQDFEANFYCLDAWEPKPKCWLNSLMPGSLTAASNINRREEEGTRPFFQQMSLAMALTCSGEVFVMTEHPDDLYYQPPHPQVESIWLTHELPALQRLYKQGVVTKLTAISASQPGGDRTEIIVEMDKSKWIDATKYLSGRSVRRGFEWTEELVQTMKMAQKRREDEERRFNSTTDPEFAREHQKRWGFCSSAQRQENPNLDYFG
ncbi:hypothetical protein DE146DRAFT_668618 [Phaeosphaeria sp. MPI-PUGE-AT-0046c]|nr:hypothetical protein DE146DRAFT_668618 [Phaeosphaeria sp. MPI-PUGE-AT-0046c]